MQLFNSQAHVSGVYFKTSGDHGVQGLFPLGSDNVVLHVSKLFNSQARYP